MDEALPATTAAQRHRLAIIGAGALGLSFAARLARSGPVAVVARNAARAQALRSGVTVGEELFRAEAYGPREAPQADWVIVLVKAGDTAAAARTAAAMHPLGVLSLQNGVVEDALRAALVDAGCAAAAAQGITTEGAYREGDRVFAGGAGETLLPPGFEAVREALRQAGFAARIEPDIRAARLAKLLVNLAINPLAALFRVPNGALLDAPHRVWLEALVREAWPVLRAEGLALAEAEALARVLAVASATAGNRASMLQDVLAGRRTELDALTGAFLEMAARHHAAVPTHQAVLQLLRLVEDAEGPAARARD